MGEEGEGEYAYNNSLVDGTAAEGEGGGGGGYKPFFATSIPSAIPPHLQYKPYTVKNPYPGVQSRLLQHFQESYQAERKNRVAKLMQQHEEPNFLRLDFKGKTTFGSTIPRYLEHKDKAPNKPEVHERNPSEVAKQKALARQLGFGAVLPRYQEQLAKEMSRHEMEPSPKDLVDKHHRENKQELGWRNPSGQKLTFQTFEEQGVKSGYSPPQLQKKPQVQSCVMNYVRGDANEIPGYHPPKPEIPDRRLPSSAARHPQKWLPGGGAGSGYQERRSNSPLKPALDDAEKAVLANRQARSESKPRPKNWVPRVASLSPAAVLRRSMSAGPSHRDPSASMGPASRTGSPSPAPRGRLSNRQGGGSPVRRQQQAQPQEEVVLLDKERSSVQRADDGVDTVTGPALVKIPEGAVIRIRHKGQRDADAEQRAASPEPNDEPPAQEADVGESAEDSAQL